MRTVTAARPADSGRHNGLAYSLWKPAAARAGVVILHGAGSCKESHHDYARALNAAGLAALTFDQRGHGDSDGPMDGRALEDVRAMADVLRSGCEVPDLRIALRGSSMGGYLALLAAPLVEAQAVVAICPASAEGLRRGVRSGDLNFKADPTEVDAFLAAHDLHDSVAELDVPVLLLHAAGDERVPVEHSRELATRLRCADSRLIVVPGGHHRSVQHDQELQAISIHFIERTITDG
jgi:alpha-beta hydrolase superfamily lysophospholipase